MLSRQEVLDGYPTELAAFETLVRSIDDADWRRPTRCEGWTVADVAAHVSGGLADVVSFNLEGAGTPEWTDKQVRDRRGRTQNEIADELAGVAKVAQDLLTQFDDEAWNGPAPAGVSGTLGAGVEGLFYDVYVHADDIRAAIGQATVPSAGLRASVHHLAGLLADKDFGPVTLDLDGVEPVPVGAGGPAVTGDAHTFVLAASGRTDPSSLGLGPEVNVYG
jgi:uncharacterized protein (TIGR03083 family)